MFHRTMNYVPQNYSIFFNLFYFNYFYLMADADRQVFMKDVETCLNTRGKYVKIDDLI